MAVVKVIDTAVVPSLGGEIPKFDLPDDTKRIVSNLPEPMQDVVKGIMSVAATPATIMHERNKLKARAEDRTTTCQWLDENEREWYAMDAMVRSRPWATNKDSTFPYPFRNATDDMRGVEGPWLGDERPYPREYTRGVAVGEVLSNLRPVPEHPARFRVLLFAGEFGNEHSFNSEAWVNLTPCNTCDIWVVSWQGWSDFNEMIDQVMRKVLSFADSTNTIWYGHGMGAIVAYEVLKRFENHHSPNLPIALMVAGCPAPHQFQEKYRPTDKFEWLKRLRFPADFDQLTVDDVADLSLEFSVALTDTWGEKTSVPDCNNIGDVQRRVIVNDLKVMSSYEFSREETERAVVIPVIAVGHDSDSLVTPASMEEWQSYSTPGTFQYIALEDHIDGEVLAAQGHGFACRPEQALLDLITKTLEKHELPKDAEKMKPDIGPTDKPVPKEVDCVIVGCGLAGIHQAKALAELGQNVIGLEKASNIGGIWNFYANKFSRVNSSEVGYRIVDQVGPASRPNEDHTPTHDILRDIFTVAATSMYGKYHCNIKVTKSTKLDDGTFMVYSENVKTGEKFETHCKAVSFHVNRRIGERRDVVYPGEKHFRGDIVYGYANEVLPLKFWGKRVIVVGAGAFAFENLRTATEHGAKHVTILGRRAGSTCPKWIDMIAFLRPVDPNTWATHKGANAISFEAWKQCYHDAGLRTPECWDEGLLKPHNHTVSVSDLVFIGGYHGMMDLKVGEIAKFRNDGQGVELKSGEQIEVDIIIKATGFHLNAQVPKISGYDKIHGNNMLDVNVHYGAEPLLDGGQFGSAKGKLGTDPTEGIDQSMLQQGFQRAQALGLPDTTLRQNAFGSAYCPGMCADAEMFAWQVKHQDLQKSFFKSAIAPVQDTVMQWASQAGTNTARTMFNAYAKLGALELSKYTEEKEEQK
mmetsp:Transcript_133039/g.284390  ORF Transcript_133039/g.284390 Transcript_133039/m.284390 type:complete len:920 (+) Transcript_133039:62-2821(+)